MSVKSASPGVFLPRVIFGTSSLGNLFTTLGDEAKLAIIRECIACQPGVVVFDSAGKYGAGLALESLGNCLRELKIAPGQVLISNKLGWVRTGLTGPEPLFEPGVWRDLKHDAVQKIGYEGILECFEQGNQLLDGYSPQLVSVHDPDEYMAGARTVSESESRYQDILDAYQALGELKKQGVVQSVGVGSKSWKIIERIAGDIDLDWIMIAGCMTVMQHPPDLLAFMQKMKTEGISIINSAVFHSGFLTGGTYFNYRLVLPDTVENKTLYRWRDYFFKICREFDVKPAEACVQFALMAPGVTTIALSTTNPGRVKANLDLADAFIPADFWAELSRQGLVSSAFFEYIL